MKLYSVAISFANGVGGIYMMPAETEAMAVAGAINIGLTAEPKGQPPVVQAMSFEIDIDQAIAFMRSLQSGKGNVVPLRLADPPEAVKDAVAADAEGKSDVRPLTVDEENLIRSQNQAPWPPVA